MRLLWLLQKLQRWFLKSRGGTLELWIDRAKTEAYFSVMLDIVMRKSLQLGLFITRLDYQIHSNLNMSHNIYIHTKFNSRLCEKTYFVMSSDDWLLKTQSFSPACSSVSELRISSSSVSSAGFSSIVSVSFSSRTMPCFLFQSNSKKSRFRFVSSRHFEASCAWQTPMSNMYNHGCTMVLQAQTSSSSSSFLLFFLLHTKSRQWKQCREATWEGADER